MDSEEISGDIRSFLLNAIGSYEELELLLLLHAHADEQWSPEAAAARLGLPLAAAAGALATIKLTTPGVPAGITPRFPGDSIRPRRSTSSK